MRIILAFFKSYLTLPYFTYLISDVTPNIFFTLAAKVLSKIIRSLILMQRYQLFKAELQYEVHACSYCTALHLESNNAG